VATAKVPLNKDCAVVLYIPRKKVLLCFRQIGSDSLDVLNCLSGTGPWYGCDDRSA